MNILKKVHFELYHITILLIVIILAQVILSYINISSIENVSRKSISIYRWQYAERIADLTTATLELIAQPIYLQEKDERLASAIKESIDYTFTQEKMQKNIDDISLLVKDENQEVVTLNNGEEIFNFLANGIIKTEEDSSERIVAKSLFNSSYNKLFKNETISSLVKGQTFHILVPFSKRGEIIAALYMKITPDFGNILQAIVGSYDSTSPFISALILVTMLGMFYITSLLVKERDAAQKQLFLNREKQIRTETAKEKESFFTKRIYHAHHKAEKIVGFIKQDLYSLNPNNLNEVRHRLMKYSNFIGRVIYDMKTYNPPVNVIRNQSFNTDLNSVLKFLVENIFRRVFKEGNQYRFFLDCDERIPILRINEYVIWQMVEPIIQNSIDHNREKNIDIKIKTEYDEKTNRTYLYISDNGSGISEELLEPNEDGIKKIFTEGTSTKHSNLSSGYGGYIAYESCRLCGWKIDVVNLHPGTLTTIEINN